MRFLTVFYTSSDYHDFAFKKLSIFHAYVANAAPIEQGDISVPWNPVYHVERYHDGERKLAHDIFQRFKKMTSLRENL